MPTIEFAIMALRKEREFALSQHRMEHSRRLEELDGLAKKAGCLPRFGLLDGLRRLAATAPRGRWLRPASRPLLEAGEPVVLTVDRVVPRETGGRPMHPNHIAVANRSSC